MNYVIDLQGGLGNRLFQYFAIKTLSKSHNTNYYVISPTDIVSDSQIWPVQFHEMVSYPEIIEPLILEERRRDCFKWQDFGWLCGISKVNPRVETIVFRGYFQSHRYLTDSILRFKIKNSMPITEIEKHENGELAKRFDVLIHVRLGDYSESIHDVGLEEYYKEALLHLVPSNALVMSDEPDKALMFLKKLNTGVDFVVIDDCDEIRQLHLMTQFSKFIGANSSLSWFGIYLNYNKLKAFLPKKWIMTEQDWQEIYFPNSMYLKHSVMVERK